MTLSLRDPSEMVDAKDSGQPRAPSTSHGSRSWPRRIAPAL